VYGWDFTETDSVAQQIKHILQNTKGIADITISRSDYQPEYHVDFDREKLARYGLNLSTAATYLRNRINGSTASYYREDGEEYDIIMKKITDVNHLALLPAGRGGEYAVVLDLAPQRKTVFDIAKSNNLFDVARRRMWAQK
jgi:Cu/Ag efflux pump CusA